MKNFLLKMWFKPIFLQVLWQFLSSRRSRDLLGWFFFAAEGGEKEPA